MKKVSVVSCLIAAVLTGACFFSTADRMERLRSTHPQWDQSTIENAAAGQVTVGMTEEMVRAARGKPESITHDGDVTIWEYAYRRADSEGRHITRAVFFVDFQNGRVIASQ